MVQLRDDSIANEEWVEIEGSVVRRRTWARPVANSDRKVAEAIDHPEGQSQADDRSGIRGPARFRIVPVQDEHYELKKTLRAAFIKQSRSDRFWKLTGLSREDLVLECREVITALQSLEAEWCNFLKRLVRIDVTRLGYDGYASDELLKQAIEKCMSDIFERPELKPYWISSPLKAEVISLSPAEAYLVTSDFIRKTIDQLVEHTVSQLDSLVGLGICGLMVRYPNHVCSYTYGYRKLSMNVSDPWEHLEVKGGDPLRDFYRRKYITKTSTQSESQISICVQEHHLMHVIESDVNDGLVHVPKFHRQVIDEIPGWIRNATCLVEGTLIGQQLIEQEQEAFQLQHQEVLKITYHCDPAVVLGQFVLTGWGPEEIKKDLCEKDIANESPELPQKDESLVDGIRSRLQRFLH
jgi:hypothetical protein